MSLLQRIFRTGATRASEADPAIDRIVKATDHRLALVKGYRDSLRGPVLAARDRMREAVARIPGPTEVSASAWSQDDTVRALFAKGSDIATAFSNDEGVRGFFALNPAADCVALLGLEKSERRVLASALQGDSIQAEVARTTVSFAEPRMLAPSLDEPAVRAELVMRALEHLALRALERVGAMRLARQALERERALLTAQLRLASVRGAGFGAMGQAAVSKLELERDLERNVRELEVAASKKVLPALLEELIQVLEAPGDLLTVEPCAFALDAMKFLVDAAAPQAVTPRIAILTLAGRGAFGVVIARFPRSELKAEQSFADARFI